MSGTRAGALKGWETRRQHTQRKTQPRSTTHISVRRHTYHGQSGFLISGKDQYGRHVSIFSRSQSEAIRMRDAIKAGQEPVFDRERRPQKYQRKH